MEKEQCRYWGKVKLPDGSVSQAVCWLVFKEELEVYTDCLIDDHLKGKLGQCEHFQEKVK